jgi:cobalt-precorrin 5A hydrolase
MDEAMIVAGLGYRSHTNALALVRAVETALADCHLGPLDLDAIAAAPIKAGDPVLREAAALLAVPLLAPEASAMRRLEPMLLTRSPHSLRHAGTPSASEAAALAGAGDNARLLGPRIVLAGVTCAIAMGGGSR